MDQREHPPPYSANNNPNVTVVHTVPVVVAGPTVYRSVVGGGPTLLTCPSCHAQIITRVEKSPSTRTHLIAACLCLFIFWPCTCMPYCIDSCNNSEHYCPNCNAYVGSYKF